MTNPNDEGQAPSTSSREVLVTKLQQCYPEREFGDDNQLFDALLEYDNELQKRYDYLYRDQLRLAEIFSTNPRMAEFIGEVLGGEDALLSCVRHFGRDFLECAGDENRLADIERENEEFNRQIRAGERIRQEMNENWQHSARAIARFKAQKGMSDEDFDDFMQQMQHVCEHVFMHDFTPDVLNLLYKGINYEQHIATTERDAEIRGRNERITLERKRSDNNAMSPLPNPGQQKHYDENRTPAFGHSRRRSVWDL